jgi:hypothetical protein
MVNILLFKQSPVASRQSPVASRQSPVASRQSPNYFKFCDLFLLQKIIKVIFKLSFDFGKFIYG